MSSKVTIRQSKGVGVVGLLTLIAGVVLLIAGGITWWTVADKLADEDITVSEDASFLAGKKVNDPFSAFAQADVINQHALDASDGQTYAQLGQNDERRETVMNASFLRASLFTSIVSFGIAALVMGLGILFIINGWALRRLAGGPPVVVETSNDPDPDRGGDRTDRTRAEKTRHEPETSKEPGTRRSGPLASSVTTPAATRANDSANPYTSSTPVVPAPGPSSTDAPAPKTAAGSAGPSTGGSRSVPASDAAPAAPREDPVRLSRTDRLGSPAPAGLRPASAAPDATAVQAPVTQEGTSSDDAVRPDGVGRPDEDSRAGGWASPADRVPPTEDTRGSSGS